MTNQKKVSCLDLKRSEKLEQWRDSARSSSCNNNNNNNKVVSSLSFGASSLGGVFRDTDDSESGMRLVMVRKCRNDSLSSSSCRGCGEERD